jgi:hypothetical protein
MAKAKTVLQHEWRVGPQRSRPRSPSTPRSMQESRKKFSRASQRLGKCLSAILNRLERFADWSGSVRAVQRLSS